MRIKHILSALLVLSMLGACNDDKRQEPVVAAEPRKDSQLYVNPDALRNPYSTIDISPMDMTYFPVDYPMLKMANPSTTPPVARVIYSRPHLGGRKLFHDVLKYGETWRLGANESTELQLYRDVTIKGRRIPAGRYILYSIPREKEWTIVVNSGTDSWGLKQDPAKDVARFEIPVSWGNPPLEYFTIIFEKTDKGMDLVFGWDEVLARLPISI